MDLAEEVLKACGTDKIEFYMNSIGILFNKVRSHLNNEDNPIAIGKSVHNFLYNLRPNRFNEGIHFLTSVLDAYKSEDINAKGGNCTALTALYNIIIERLGIPMSTVVFEEHILSRIKNPFINVENTIKNGFGITLLKFSEDESYINVDNIHSSPNEAIIATTYFISAQDAFHRGNIDLAWELNEKSINLFYDSNNYRLRSAIMRMSEY